jgi:hypothetical protein
MVTLLGFFADAFLRPRQGRIESRSLCPHALQGPHISLRQPSAGDRISCRDHCKAQPVYVVTAMLGAPASQSYHVCCDAQCWVLAT